jgi:polygalacturonase
MIKLILLFYLLLLSINAGTIDFENDVGGIPDNSSLETCWKNGELMNQTLSALTPGDLLIIPNKTFYIMGGIQAQNLNSVTIQIDGTLSFSTDTKEWPKNAQGQVLECMNLSNAVNVTFTSTGRGVLDGSGGAWWGFMGLGLITHGSNRPRLFVIGNSQNILIENITLHNSPYWSFWVYNVNGLEVRYTDIIALRTSYNSHNLIDVTAANSDGFDVTGQNVWIHDCYVWNQNDCISIKDSGQNMLFERITASGFGLAIGSLCGTTVNNVTFRDIYMPESVKGVYLKFAECDVPGLISNILFENIYLESPSDWPIWIGPLHDSICKPHPCSTCWPEMPFSQCFMPATGKFENITLRNITISNPKNVGIIMGNETNPMVNVVFDGVKIVNVADPLIKYDYYKCEGVVNGVAIGDTNPVPECFEDQTTKSQILQL